MVEPLRFNFAMAVLPSIIFFSALVELVNHIGLLGICMRAFALIFCTFTRCTAPEAIAAAANVSVQLALLNSPAL
jgi:nucleoside permease NupC